MKILIISRTSWNDSNSFGNTFNNLFYGMQDVELYNICCQRGLTQNNIVIKTLQMSEISILRSLKGGSVAVEPVDDVGGNIELSAVKSVQRARKTWMFVTRDMIWNVGGCKWKKAVMNFIDEVKPDVIYLPIYPSWYMCEIDLYAIKKAGTPVVAHITDDNYNYIPGMSRSAHWYQSIVRRYLRKIISKCEYIEVFADTMKVEYEREFGKPCYVIGKGMKPEDVLPPQKLTDVNELHFVYTGGIGGERYDVLLDLANVLKGVGNKKCLLDVYSATPLTDKMKEDISANESFVFHGAVSGAEIVVIQRNADFLVHVEGFSTDSIASTRMSFSTKIPDYLSTGNVLFAIGPSGINSIDIIRDKGIGVICDNLEDLPNVVFQLSNNGYDLHSIQQRAYEYMIKDRNILTIQDDMLGRLKRLMN